MRVIYKLFLLLMMTILLVSTVSATKVFVNPVNETSNKIYFDELAHFNLTIKNTDDISHIYTWATNPVEWIIDTTVSSRIDAGESENFDLAIRPRPSNYRGQGFYVIPLVVETHDEKITKPLTIYIKSLDDRLLSYTPSVALGASIKEVVDPREPATVHVVIRNRNMLEIKNITLNIDGENFKKSEDFSLSGLEEKTLEYRFDIDDLQKPGTYQLKAGLFYKNKTISTVDSFYDVAAFSVIKRDSNTASSWFKKTTISTLTNEGNVDKSVTSDIEIKWYKYIFTSVDVEASSVDKISKKKWELMLAPDEVATVTIKENYRVLPVLFVLIILIILGYFQFRSPIVLKKQTIVTGQDEEGISEMKVRIFIKNRSKNPFYNVRLLDRAPSIAQVHVGSGLGILEPSKIVHTEKKGTIIKWDFESLESYEERIVTYAIKARLKIIGTLGLPSVKVKFENVKGRQRTTESGRAIIGDHK